MARILIARSGGQRRGKYHNVPTTVGKHRFDSQAEANHYLLLAARQAAGEISHLRLQPRYTLQDTVRRPGQPTIRKVVYVADFAYQEPAQSGHEVVVDVKGRQTPVFRLKQALFRARYPDLDFRIIPA